MNEAVDACKGGTGCFCYQELLPCQSLPGVAALVHVTAAGALLDEYQKQCVA
jgi:hypothetical protein